MAGKVQRPIAVNVRLSDTARYILDQLQDYYGLSQASIFEMLLREDARRLGINIPGSGADRVRKAALDAAAEAEQLD